MKKTIGVIFSGYGQQFVTMGKDLYNDSRHVQDLFEQASMCLDINFVKLCFASSDAGMAEIDKGYQAILLTQVSIYSELAEAGLRPDFIAGYGIGEYSAAIASGSLSFADGLYLINKYAKFFKSFVEKSPDYGVLQITRGFTAETIEALCKEFSTDDKKLFVSAYNTDHGFYIGGHIDLINQVKEYCKINEIRKVKELNIAYGLHNSAVDSVVNALSPYFFKIDFKPLKFPVITNVDGAYVTSAEALESAVLRRVNSPVLWDDVMNGLVGCEILICVGPGKQNAEWAQLKYPDKEIYTVEGLDDVIKLKKMLEEDGNDSEPLGEKDGRIVFGRCRIDGGDGIYIQHDLTIADEINELPGDYDIDENE